VSFVVSGLCDEQRADHSFRGVLPNVVCLFVCDLETSIVRWPTPDSGCGDTRKQHRFCTEITVGAAVSPFDMTRLLPAGLFGVWIRSDRSVIK